MKYPTFKLAGYKIRTTNENNQAMQDIGALWGRVLSQNLLAKISNQTSTKIFALYYEYEKDHTRPYSVLLGVSVNNLVDLPTDIIGVEIPTQNYTVFEANGPMPEALIQTWQKIWQQNDALARNFQFDFEEYDPQNPNAPQAKVWIGLIP